MTIAQLGLAQDTADRHAAIERYGVLDTPTEAAFDAIVRLAAELLDAPMAAINLLARDRQWFQAEVGMGVRELPLNGAFCSTAILEDAVLVVPDATRDPRFAWFPIVKDGPRVRFYAGALVRTPDGIAIGTLCVGDNKTRPDGLTALQRLGLRTLADQVMAQMELRRIGREKQQLALALRASEADARERAREAQDARGRLDALLAAAPVGISYVDRGGAQVLSNAELERLWGAYPRTTGLADYAAWQGWWADHSARHGQPLAPEDWPQARILRGERADGDIIEIVPFGADAGERRTVMLRAAPVRDAAGAIDGSVVAVMDISERRVAETAAQAWRARLEAILEAGAIGTWTWDAASGRFDADASTAAMFGLEPRVTFDAYLAAVHPDDVASVQASLQGARAAGMPYQVVHRVRPAGGGAERTVDSRGRIERDAAGNALRASGVVIDITRQAAAEARLHSSERARLAGEQRYRTVLSGIDVAFCIIEMLYDDAGNADDYRIVETNAAFPRQTGLHDALGKTIRELVPEHDVRWSRLYGRVAATGMPVRIEQYSPSLGRWMDVYAARVGDADSRQVAVLLRDITDEKTRNDTLQRLADDLADANRRQSEFLATLAHELRDPLAPVRTGLDLLRINAGNADVLARVRPMMERQVNHLVHLVDDLLDLARISSGKVELRRADVLLKDVVLRAAEMVQPLVEARRHVLRVDTGAIEAPPVRVHADATRLAQVIGNLLTNAARYTPAGGTLCLTARRSGAHARIEVADNGIGIAPDDLPRLFDMFTQVGRQPEQEFGGLGIGLHLVKQMTELHGGTVGAASAGAGQGSTFAVELPLLAAGTDGAADPASGAAAPVTGLRILVADDNADAATLLRELLELHGHTVVVAASGTDALEQAARSRPDLALLDIGMPGLSGLEVARRLRADPACAGMRLVALSGWGTEEDRARSEAAGFERHLTKPVELQALLALVGGG